MHVKGWYFEQIRWQCQQLIKRVWNFNMLRLVSRTVTKCPRFLAYPYRLPLLSIKTANFTLAWWLSHNDICLYSKMYLICNTWRGVYRIYKIYISDWHILILLENRLKCSISEPRNSSLMLGFSICIIAYCSVVSLTPLRGLWVVCMWCIRCETVIYCVTIV